MSELTPQIADGVLAACQANAGEVAGALSRTFDTQITLTVGAAGTFAGEKLPTGPGLAALFTFGDVGFVAILAEASGLLPAWYQEPDKTGQSKLSTLAQELSMLLVPESMMADDFKAQRVDDLAAAVQRAGIADDAAAVTIELTAGDKTTALRLIWPLAKPKQLFGEAKAKAAPPAEAGSPVKQSVARGKRPARMGELPSYSRSLLKITVPVSVVLATKRESVHDVVELAPGTIIKFSKSCEEPLNLYVGDQKVAEGEAVKVGDKFGFRVTAMTPPEEHFLKVRPGQAG
jgi:flagellar motor switch protein FliN